MRNALRWSMLDILEKNGPFFDQCQIFDIGKTWEQERLEKEHNVLACLIWNKKPTNWQEDSFLKTKAVVDNILSSLKAKGKLEYNLTDYDAFHPKQQAIILLNKQAIGSIKTIHPALLEQLKLSTTGSATILEIDLTLLQHIVKPSKIGTTPRYHTLQDQVIWRDLNFVISQEQNFATVTDAVAKVKEVSHVEVFDIYQGEHLAENTKSIGIRMEIQADKDIQLTTEAINTIMDKAIANAEKAGATLRS